MKKNKEEISVCVMFIIKFTKLNESTCAKRPVNSSTYLSLLNSAFVLTHGRVVDPMSNSFWSQEGFQYHHAEPGYVMLTYWIPAGPSTLPANASHQVGVGGFVINDNNEV